MAIQTIPSTLIADNAISAAKIASGIISADDIADNSLTAAKISASTSPTFGGLTINATSTVGQTLHNTSGASIYTRYQNNGGNDNYIGYVNNNFSVYPNNVTALTVASGGDISFYEDTGTTAKLFWDASAESLGIGTSSPAEILEFDRSSGDMFVRYDKAGTFKGLVGISDNTASGSTGAVAGDMILRGETNLLLDTGGTTRLKIDSSGNVGIGTNNPTSNTLTITGKYLLLSDSQTKFGDNGIIGGGAADGNSRLEYYTGKDFSITQSGTNRMTINSDGNVGIGTSSFSYASSGRKVLELNGSSSALYGLKIGDTTKGYVFTEGNDVYLGAETGLGIILKTNSAQSIEMQTNGSKAMEVDSGGRVSIGSIYSPDSNISGDFDTISLGGLINIHGSAGRTGAQNFRTGISYNAYPTGQSSSNAYHTSSSADFQPIRLSFLQGFASMENARSATAGSSISWNEIFKFDEGLMFMDSYSLGNLASYSGDLQGGVFVPGLHAWRFDITADNTWRKVLGNVRNIAFFMFTTVGDAASKNTAIYTGAVTSPAYGVSSFSQLHSTSGGFNAGTFNYRIVADGSTSYDMEVQFSSYYSSSNTASGYLYILRLY